MSIKTTNFDQIDRKIAKRLIQDAQITNADLGRCVGLSASSVNERVRKLKSCGIIRRVVAHVDSAFFNRTLCSFIYVLVEGREDNRHFQRQAEEHSVITEGYQVTGE